MFEKHFTAHGLEKLVDYQVGVKKKDTFSGLEIATNTVAYAITFVSFATKISREVTNL